MNIMIKIINDKSVGHMEIK